MNFESLTRPKGSRFVSCPACGCTVPLPTVNEHLDSCMGTSPPCLKGDRQELQQPQPGQPRRCADGNPHIVGDQPQQRQAGFAQTSWLPDQQELCNGTMTCGGDSTSIALADSGCSPEKQRISYPSALSLLRKPPLAFVQQGPGRKLPVTDDELPQHAPCELIRNALPTALATQLLQEMLADSARWEQPKWFLFGQVHDAPRKSQYFELSDQNGLKDVEMDTKGVPERPDCTNPGLGSGVNAETSANVGSSDAAWGALREAADIISGHVNRLSGSWPVDDADRAGWAPTYCFGNLYRDGRDCSGAHADRLTLLGVRPIIASLSLGATRLFRIRRAVAAADNGTAAATLSPESTQRASMATGDLAVASVVGDAAAGGGAAPGKRRKVMPPAQEAYKHEVPRTVTGISSHPIAGKQRVNLTFRRLKSEFEQNVPRCKCGNRAILKARYTAKPLRPKSYPANQSFYFACDNTQSHGCGFHAPFVSPKTFETS